ncbi:MAG: hypothetical protein WC326_15165 [Candidatus Delongbacteria bacterium]
MTAFSHRHLLERLRADHGYSARSAKSVLQDVLSVLLDQLEDLQIGDSLTLTHLGRLECQAPKARRWAWPREPGSRDLPLPTRRIRFTPAAFLAASLRSKQARISTADPRADETHPAREDPGP